MPALATYEQAVSPENVAKVSLTGLSFRVSSIFSDTAPGRPSPSSDSP